MRKLLGVSMAAIAVLFGATSAKSAGFQLSEYSTTGLGRAFAGAGIMGDDFSALGYNPAGMGFAEKSGYQLGATYVGIRSRVKGSAGPWAASSTAARVGKTNPYMARTLPNAFAQYKLNDRATAGIGIYVPFGLATDYNENWFGNSHALLSEIQAVNISPAFSYKVTDQITFGAALNFQHASAKLTNRAEQMTAPDTYYYAGGFKTKLAGDDLSVGYSLGLTYEPVKGTRFGVAYRSKLSHKITGHLEKYDAAPYAKSDVFAKITTPETVTFSAMHQLNNQWTLSGTARWTRWTQFDTLNIMQKQPDGSWNNISSTPEKWRNTWFLAVGADYKLNEQWTFRTGLAYDMAAARGPDLRTARIPDGRRTWASVGASYTKNNWQFDVGYAHLFVNAVHARHGSTTSSNFDAKYTSRANIISLQAQYKF